MEFFTSPPERTLRKITIATFLPALPLLIASGAMSDQVYSYWWRNSPACAYFGIIPLTFSSISSYINIILADEAKSRPETNATYASDAEQKERDSKTRAWAWVVIDFVVAAAYFGVLLPVWIIEPDKMNGHAGWMMLESYATCFLILNMFIHLYLFICRANIIFSLFKVNECPHCHQKLDGIRVYGRSTGEGYSLLRGDDLLDQRESPEATPRQSLETPGEADIISVKAIEGV